MGGQRAQGKESGMMLGAPADDQQRLLPPETWARVAGMSDGGVQHENANTVAAWNEIWSSHAVCAHSRSAA
jgi:hypothetical protein